MREKTSRNYLLTSQTAFLNPLLWGLLLWVTTSACFPMGLPEYVAGDSATKPESVYSPSAKKSLPRAVVLTPPPSEDSVDEILGYQFLLGVIPFTHLYFQNGANRILREVLIDQLSQAGYDVYLTPAADAEHRLALLRPVLVVDASVESLSLNAYDALFFRIVSLHGEASLRTFAPTKLGPWVVSKQLPIEIDSNEYKTSAHAPMLSAMFEDALRDSIRESLSTLQRQPYSSRYSGLRRLNPAKGRVLKVSSPKSSSWVLPSLGSELSTSYGFSGLPPYGKGAIARVMQRGIARGLDEADLPYVVSVTAGGGSDRIRAWSLETTLLEVSVNDVLDMKVVVRLKDATPGSPVTLQKSLCELEGEALPDEDGYAVRALENAMARVVRRSLGVTNAVQEGGKELPRLVCSEVSPDLRGRLRD